MILKTVLNDELKYMINAAKYLAKGYDEQYDEMEWFARWDLPEEIGEEWIDAKGIICSPQLLKTIPHESLVLLLRILFNFENAFTNPAMIDVWSNEAMKTHKFWEEQRQLAKSFLESLDKEYIL